MTRTLFLLAALLCVVAPGVGWGQVWPGGGTGCPLSGCTYSGGVNFSSGLTTGVFYSQSSDGIQYFIDNKTGVITLGLGYNSTLGPSYDLIVPRVPIVLQGWAWADSTIPGGPVIQNATFTGSTTSALSAFGMFLQQTDNSSNTGANPVGIYEHLIMNGTSAVGARTAGQFVLDITQNANTSAKVYVGLASSCNLNWTEPGNGGTCFGENPVASIGSGVTASQVVGGEADTWVQSGAVVHDKIGYQIVDVLGSTYGVQATGGDDVGLSINNQYAPSSTLGRKVGLEFGRSGGFMGVSTTGTMIYAQGNLGAGFTVAKGIDWSLGTFTGNVLTFPSFSLDGSGNVVAASFKNNGGDFHHRTTKADVNYTVLSTDNIIAFTSLTATRTLTIPCGSLGTAANPQEIIVKDESGSAGTFPITLSATIDGATNKTISTPYGATRLYANGSACFTW